MKKLIIATLLFFVFCTTHAQPSPIITTLAGNGTSGYSGDNGPATAAQLKTPQGLAVDDAGNVYVGDLNHVIRKISPIGIITAFAGTGVLGYSGDNGPATAAKIYYADGITTDKKGNVYFTDNTRVRKVDVAGVITTFAGNAGPIGGDGGPATAAGLGILLGVCSDDTGNIYIAGGNGHVRKVDTFGIIHAFAGGGTTYTEGGPATATHLNQSQIACDNQGNLYIADEYYVRKIATSGTIHNIAGSGGYYHLGDNGPATAAGLYVDHGVATDKCGNVYIADSYNNRIRVVNDLGIINTFAGTGYGTDTTSGAPLFTGGYTGDGGPATAAELFLPFAICLDKHGNIYFTEQNNNVVRYIHMDSCVRAVSHVGIAAPPALPEGEVVSVFPNPNTGTFTINIHTALSETATVLITNIMGAKVREFTTVTNKEHEMTMNLPPGMYLLSATTARSRHVARVVVR